MPLVAPILIIVGFGLLPIEFNTLILLVFLLDADTLVSLYYLPNLLKAFKK